MTDRPLHGDSVLSRVTAVRVALRTEDLSATGARAAAIQARVLATVAPPIPTRRARLRSAITRRALRRPAGVILALGLPIAASASLVLLVAWSLSGSGSIGPQPAAAAVLRGVAAALDHRPGTILLERYDVTYAGHHRKSIRWQQVQIYETPAGPGPQNSLYYSNQPGQPAEQAVVAGQQEIYLKATNTVYIASIVGDRITPGPKPGTLIYTAPDPARAAPLTITAAQARALRDGTETVYATPVGGHIPDHVKLTIGPTPRYRDEITAIRALLRAHRLRVNGPATIDGHRAIKLSSGAFTTRRPDQAVDSGLEFYVDPRTYRPIIEIVSRPPLFYSRQTFTEYETLPITPANERLLSLTARHPHARIDRNPADYQRAAALLGAFTG